MEKLEILEKEVENLTNKIIEHQEEAMRLDVIRDVLQKEIEYQKPKNTSNDELPF